MIIGIGIGIAIQGAEGDSVPPTFYNYLRPDGVSTYLLPDGTSTYKRL
jgi:hypothetical protein